MEVCGVAFHSCESAYISSSRLISLVYGTEFYEIGKEMSFIFFHLTGL